MPVQLFSLDMQHGGLGKGSQHFMGSLHTGISTGFQG
ncbi:hypothetical protein P378_07105 [Desulforamulus profundi]|uniref:Uncharacterized protein n=1 Tax=Desulforamulus profundi TaxID=1383067 RepID=A0A2C6MFC9_9FIRM|nr:hypothetical protein P378_07105 [Desulforamulus profundi]